MSPPTCRGHSGAAYKAFLIPRLQRRRMLLREEPEAGFIAGMLIDAFRSYRYRLHAMPAEVWPERFVKADRRTAAASIHLDPQCRWPQVTGVDPTHSNFTIAEALPTRDPDSPDLEFDVRDAVRRWSTRDPALGETVKVVPREAKKGGKATVGAAGKLSPAARALLHSAVTEGSDEVAAKARGNREAAEELRKVLNDPCVIDHPMWKAAGWAPPPRGSLERVARRIGGVLHPSLAPFGWPSAKAFAA